MLNIKSSINLDNSNISIYDLKGKLVMTTVKTLSTDEILSLDVNQLSNGVYVLNITSEDKNFSKQIVKK